MNLMDCFGTVPPEQDFIIPGFMAGTPGGLVAPGSTGKSFFALQVAAAVASDCPQANTLGLQIVKHGKVIYLNLEDPPAEIHRRLYALGQRLDLVARQSIADNLTLSARQGIHTDVLSTAFQTALRKAAGDRTRLIIIDTLSRCHTRDENDNGQMSEVVAALELLCRQTGAGLMFLHHTSKAAALAGQGGMAQAARGASALVDNARWCGNLSKMSEEEADGWTGMDGQPIGADRRGYFVRYALGKQNYGELESSQWFNRTAGGILAPVELRKVKKAGKGKGDWL
ncbi:helicase RepA family protein [Paraburkholderia sp. CNPSo 3274]|uniref:helicase RepA family protein n=1 Tax=Paraburkholderia sp. CNPSo 3274 TaxID=2940932 RepID=UPI0020B74FCC|nr:helicase RepA family protein [Paraburkholderia sp. CNPSo 3274]MCP3713129.1 helicase RepA family protein [Paraburkholderia sp. CNPSo 3274]